MSELLHAEFSAPAAAIDDALVRDGQWEGEVTHRTCAGESVIVASRWALQRDAGGAAVRILTIDNDITRHKQAEAALEQSRSDQIRFKDEFLSHVSHELRSPLTAVKQFTTILLGGLAGELNKEQREYQQIVLKNIRQLQSMIDDLLEVTRLETGKLTIEPESISVSDAVNDTLNTLQVTARAKGVELSCDLPADLPAAYADQIRLQQILIILLDNAIKFTPEGGDIAIQARLLPDDPRFLLLEVSDTGCGIEPGDRRADLRTPLPGRRTQRGQPQGTGPRPVHLQGAGDAPGRPDLGEAPAAERQHLLLHAAGVFASNTVIAPLLKNEQWPARRWPWSGSRLRLPGGWPSRVAREEWSHHARNLVQSCLLPDLDVLLPTARAGAERERFFVACFTDEKGASSLANRIRKQFERVPRLKHPGLTLAVSHRMLPPFASEAGASTEQVVTSLAIQLEESIKRQPSLRLSIQ